ncbi:MAG: phosphonoacetaldehyde hydrolase [Tannerellaceae bacterium]|nr:phosphonoacetaldehyde hydrolase [Tannerellaceae bacterium]
MTRISCAVMDWAGTTVDYGCFAPLNAFLKVFSEEKKLNITYRQAREPMGLLKIDHIKAILRMPDVAEQFCLVYGRDWNDRDVQEMYQSFEKHLFASLSDFTTPVPGVIDTVATLRDAGIKIGSTTGYTAKMMEIVRPGAEQQGYRVDNLVTPDGLPAGRPAPYMIYKNMIDLAIPSVEQVVKVGDTIADIEEGVNAKVWSVGIIEGSNEMGLTLEEMKQTPIAELDRMKKEVRARMMAAGANFVLDNITLLPGCIEEINTLINER